MITLMADSTCDLSDEVLAEHDIKTAALSIHIGDKEYQDRIDIQPDEFYEMMGSLEEFPTTGMPSPATFISIFEGAIAKGSKEILCICMSSGTSGSYQSAALAKRQFEEDNPESDVQIHIADSRCMSHGSGWLLIKCARMRAAGATYDELVTFVEENKTKVKHYLSVDDLNHLIKSGRISNAGAFIGKMLMLKPVMSMKDGKGAIVAKERGQKRVLKHYVEQFVARQNPEMTDFIIIGYTSEKLVAETLHAKILKETDFKGDIYVMQMGVSVGTHVGPGAISMFFMEK
ncbi:DegV family protein [Paenalkalicoccus suaedae]|uniref:DegV family protein n=1 Tax=Paenalkalicoccus suaedae TaxID=2592382 RepID=A0A859FJM6_9BACI|nr:DegV family protein [Paenalkalicoccus suaedae]QKS72998.1 DegV family protein [Paenalkalicoccus suaedae]